MVLTCLEISFTYQNLPTGSYKSHHRYLHSPATVQIKMAAKVISSGFRYTTLPEGYVRPVNDRPNLSQVSDCNDVPVIDIGCGDRRVISRQIGDACRNYGFFQVS